MSIAMADVYLLSPVRGDMSHSAPDGAWKIKSTFAAINISSLRDFEHNLYSGLITFMPEPISQEKARNLSLRSRAFVLGGSNSVLRGRTFVLGGRNLSL
jgi:hypothetical protein